MPLIWHKVGSRTETPVSCICNPNTRPEHRWETRRDGRASQPAWRQAEPLRVQFRSVLVLWM